MTYTLTDSGWEYILRIAGPGTVTPPATLTAGLYRDEDDDVSETDDLDAIQSEPDGSDYARQTPASDSWVVEFSNARFQMTISDIEFQTADATVSASSWFIVAEFQAQSDSSPQPHLLMTGPLEGSVDLSLLDSYTLNNAGLYDGD